MMKIALDAMGGDNAPARNRKRCITSFREFYGYTYTLYGDEQKMEP